MTGTQIGVSSVGMGFYIEPHKIRARLESSEAAISKGEVLALNLSGTGITTASLSPAPLAGGFGGDPGDGFDEWSTVRTLLVTSGTRLAYPLVVAAEAVQPGMKGDFWLKHPSVLVKGNENVGSNNLARGAPVIYDYMNGADRAVRWYEAAGDAPNGPTPIRMLGWGLGTTDGAAADIVKASGTLLPMAFDGMSWIISAGAIGTGTASA